MANGPIGRVAPTQAQQGGTYSDAINRQVDLIQRQRAVNLQNRLAQDQKNREFRTEQLQNIYDFDVTALPPGYAAEIKEAQDKMASWLDPNSEVRYENKEQLIADISRLNNYYLAGKNQRLTSNEARTDYDNALIGGTSVAGAVMAGTETTRNNRQAAADAGGFGAYSVDGAPGSLSITGIQMQEGENGQYAFDEATGERIDILDSNFSDGSGFFRLDLVAAAPYLSTATEGALTDERLDGTNSLAIAQIDYDVLNDAQKTRLQKEVYEQKTAGQKDAKPFEEWVKTADQAAIERLGLDEASLVKAMADSYDTGLEARPGTAGADAFDFNKSIINMPQLSKPVKLRSEDEELAGTIEGAQFQQGLDLDTLQEAPNGAPLIPVEVAYVQSNGTIVKKILDPATNPVEYDAFMEAIGRRGKEQLLQYSGYYQTPEGPQVDVGEDPQPSGPRDMGVDETAEVRENLEDIEDLTIAGSADGSPGAQLESDRQMLLDDIKDAEDELKLQMSLAGGNAGNLTGRMEAMERLVELQEQLGPINDALEELGIERIEYEPIDASGAGAGGADPDSSTAQADPVATDTGSAESRPLQTEPGGVYTSAQLEQNLESWEKELLAGTRPEQTVKSGVAVKAKNFGNLRPNNSNPYQSGVYQVSEGNEYQNFASYDEGLKGLIWDIKSKQHLDGLKSSAVGKNANIADVIMKYAPPEDSNNPVGYTNHIVNFVNERLGLTGEEAFTSKSKASEFPTELLVEAIISKEDISLYKEMKDRGYFEGDKISGIAGNINIETTRELRSRA